MKTKTIIFLIILACIVGWIGNYYIGDAVPSWDWWSAGLREAGR